MNARGEHGDRAGQDAEHAPVGQRLAALAQAHPRRVRRGQQPDGQSGQDREDDEDPHGAAPAPGLADQDAERETCDDGDRAAASHDGQRSGSVLVVAEDASRAVRRGLVPGRSERGEHSAAGDDGEVRPGGLHDDAGEEDGHAGGEEGSPVPVAGERRR